MQSVARDAELCEELSRCYGMLAVILKRKSSNKQQDIDDSSVYWNRIQRASIELAGLDPETGITR